jgi:hypothetical protein
MTGPDRVEKSLEIWGLGGKRRGKPTNAASGVILPNTEVPSRFSEKHELSPWHTHDQRLSPGHRNAQLTPRCPPALPQPCHR